MTTQPHVTPVVWHCVDGTPVAARDSTVAGQDLTVDKPGGPHQRLQRQARSSINSMQPGDNLCAFGFGLNVFLYWD